MTYNPASDNCIMAPSSGPVNPALATSISPLTAVALGFRCREADATERGNDGGVDYALSQSSSLCTFPDAVVV